MKPWVLTFVLKGGQVLPLLHRQQDAEAHVESWAEGKIATLRGVTVDGVKWVVRSESAEAAYCGPAPEARPQQPAYQPDPYREVPWQQASSGLYRR